MTLETGDATVDALLAQQGELLAQAGALSPDLPVGLRGFNAAEAAAVSAAMDALKVRHVDIHDPEYSDPDFREIRNFQGGLNMMYGQKDNEAVKQAQIILTTLGYDTKGIDGDFGPGTLEAVKKFQADHHLPVTGVLDTGATYTALLEAAEAKMAPSSPKHEPALVAAAEGLTGVSGGTDVSTATTCTMVNGRMERSSKRDVPAI